MVRRTIAVLILAAEALFAAYLVLVVWLASVWMVNDDFAFRMNAADWYIQGAWRLGEAVVVGLIFYGLTYLINRRWVTPWLPSWPRLGRWTAVILTICIVMSGMTGVISFVINKPFM